MHVAEVYVLSLLAREGSGPFESSLGRAGLVGDVPVRRVCPDDEFQQLPSVADTAKSTGGERAERPEWAGTTYAVASEAARCFLHVESLLQGSRSILTVALTASLAYSGQLAVRYLPAPSPLAVDASADRLIGSCS